MITLPPTAKSRMDLLAPPHPDTLAYEAAVLILDVLATAGAEPDKWPPVRLKAAIQVKVREALDRYGRAFLVEKPAYVVNMSNPSPEGAIVWPDLEGKKESTS